MSRSLWLYVLLGAAFIIGLLIIAGGVAIVLNGAWLQGVIYTVIGAAYVALAVFEIKSERKSNGRYRKASQAHRTGTSRGPSDGTFTGGRAVGRTSRAGAGMNPYPYGSSSYWAYEAVVNGRQTMLTSRSTPVVHVAPTARPTGDFDGKVTEFAAGVVTGTRSFDVDKLGRLLGVTYPAVWLPGENEAKCLKVEHLSDAYSYIGGGDLYRKRLSESGRPAHGLTDCGHGFYGYYEGSNDFYEPGRVMGVVEAYGEAIVGTRGFRASKARIVALHIPVDVAVGRRHLIVRNYPGVPIFDSFDAMIAEFPPDDAGEGVGPETDPDFWTRQVES